MQRRGSRVSVEPNVQMAANFEAAHEHSNVGNGPFHGSLRPCDALVQIGVLLTPAPWRVHEVRGEDPAIRSVAALMGLGRRKRRATWPIGADGRRLVDNWVGARPL